MNDKTLGQIGFEASQQWSGGRRVWNEIPLNEQAYWEHVANAIYMAASAVLGVRHD